MHNQEDIIAFLEAIPLTARKLDTLEFIRFLRLCKTIVQDPNLIDSMVNIYKTCSKLDNTSLPNLSLRELEIYALIGASKSSQEIATELAISITTVATHRKNIIKKLGLKGSGQLQRHALIHELSTCNNTLLL